jgi:BlaI family transcriptional regulator, penicillinase repressor
LKIQIIVYICIKIFSMIEITKSQEEILKVLWDIKEAVVSDVIEKLPDPKPAYNTVATVIKVLEKKGYLSHKVYGKTYVYFAIVNQKDYAKYVFKDSLKSIFNNSLNQAVSFFVKQNKTSLSELEELRNYIEEEIKKKTK